MSVSFYISLGQPDGPSIYSWVHLYLFDLWIFVYILICDLYFHFTHTSCKAYRVCVYNPGAPIQWCKGYFRRCWLVEFERRLRRLEVVRIQLVVRFLAWFCVWGLVWFYLWVCESCEDYYISILCNVEL